MIASDDKNRLGFHQLSVLLASEVLPKRRMSLGYALSETKDNQVAVLRTLVKLLGTGSIETVGICDPQSPEYDYGYLGPSYCINLMKNMKIGPNKISIIRSLAPMERINTATEMELVAEWVRSMKVKEFLIVAPMFHILRSYLSTLTALINKGLEDTRVFVAGVPLPVYEEVIHSQGVQRGTRAEISLEEIEKCAKYTNLISANDALVLHKEHRIIG